MRFDSTDPGNLARRQRCWFDVMMLHRAAALALVAFGVSSLVLGCDAPGFSRKAKAPAGQVVAKAQAAETSTTSASLGDARDRSGPSVDSVGLSVSNEIARACGINHAHGEAKSVAPSFEYDSAALAEDDRVLLAQIARCLTEGALRGRRVSLVGRADSRGEPEYNMILGGSRADAVKRYMVDLGVGRDHLVGTSRGELDAIGTNEVGYARDRRVDVELLD